MKSAEARLSGNRKVDHTRQGLAVVAALALAACGAPGNAKSSVPPQRETTRAVNTGQEANTSNTTLTPETQAITPEQTQQSEYMKKQVQLAAESLALDISYVNNQQTNPAGNIASDRDGQGFTMSFPTKQTMS